MNESNRSAFSRTDNEEAGATRHRERTELARSKPEGPATRRETNGAGTFLRIICLPIAALAVLFVRAAEPGVARTTLPIFVGLLIAVYFLPTIEAALRKHPNLLSIGLVNLFLGWSLVGWVVSIAWACRKAEAVAPPQARTDTARFAPPPPLVQEEPNAQRLQPVPVADEIQKLAALRDKGVLTEEEFGLQKAKLLA